MDKYAPCEDTVQFWMNNFLDTEIEDVKGAISNEHIWLMGSDTEEAVACHTQNIADLEEYLARLEYIKNKYCRCKTMIDEADRLEFIGQVIDIFEDFLDEKGIEIINPEKDDSDNPAIIYGSDFGKLEDGLERILHAWNLL